MSKTTLHKMLACLIAAALVIGGTTWAFSEPVPAAAEEAIETAAIVEVAGCDEDACEVELADDEAVEREEAGEVELASTGEEEASMVMPLADDGDLTFITSEVKFVEDKTAFSPERELAPSVSATVGYKDVFGIDAVKTIDGEDYWAYGDAHAVEGYDFCGAKIVDGVTFLYYKSNTQLGASFAYIELSVNDDGEPQYKTLFEKEFPLQAETTFPLSMLTDEYPMPEGYHFLKAFITDSSSKMKAIDADGSFTTTGAFTPVFAVAVYVGSDAAGMTMPPSIDDADMTINAHFVNLDGETIAPDEKITVKMGEYRTFRTGVQSFMYEKMAPKEKAGQSFVGVAAENELSALKNVKKNLVYNFDYAYRSDVDIFQMLPSSGDITFVYNGTSNPAPAADKTIKLIYHEHLYSFVDPDNQNYQWYDAIDEDVHTTTVSVPSTRYLNDFVLYDMGDYKFSAPSYFRYGMTALDSDRYYIQPASELPDEITLNGGNREEVCWINFYDKATGDELLPRETLIYYLPEGDTHKAYAQRWIDEHPIEGLEFVSLEQTGSSKQGLEFSAYYKDPTPEEFIEEPPAEEPPTPEEIIPPAETPKEEPPAPIEEEEIIEDAPIPQGDYQLIETGDAALAAVGIVAGMAALIALAYGIRRKMTK